LQGSRPIGQVPSLRCPSNRADQAANSGNENAVTVAGAISVRVRSSSMPRRRCFPIDLLRTVPTRSSPPPSAPS